MLLQAMGDKHTGDDDREQGPVAQLIFELGSTSSYDQQCREVPQQVANGRESIEETQRVLTQRRHVARDFGVPELSPHQAVPHNSSPSYRTSDSRFPNVMEGMRLK